MAARLKLIFLMIVVCGAGVYGMVRWAGRAGIRSTIARLASSDPSESRRAADRLTAAGSKAVMPLIEMLAADDQESLRLQGTQVLARLKDPRAIPLMVLMLEKSGSPEIRRACADSFVLMGTRDPAVMSRLLESLQADDDPSVRKASLVAFVKLLGDDATPQMIATFLKDRELRSTVTKLFQYHGDGRALPLLCRMLIPYKKELSENAARALGRLKDERALSFLWSAWDLGKPEDFAKVVESTIRKILGRGFTQAKYNRLIVRLQEDGTRESAKKALLAGMPESAVYLERAAHEEDGAAVEQATRVLAQMAGMVKKQELRNPAVRDCYVLQFDAPGASGAPASARAVVIRDEKKLKSKSPLLGGKRKVDFSKEAVVALDVSSDAGYEVGALSLSSKALELALKARKGAGGGVRWLCFLVLDAGLARFDSVVLTVEGGPPAGAPRMIQAKLE